MTRGFTLSIAIRAKICATSITDIILSLNMQIPNAIRRLGTRCEKCCCSSWSSRFPELKC